jgi:hypothetical protein
LGLRRVDRAQEFRLRWGTRLLGAVSVSTVGVLLGAEFQRVRRLGRLPLERSGSIGGDPGERRLSPVESVKVVVEGYRVSSTRENANFNMLMAFFATSGITRGITYVIHTRGRLGPLQDLSARGRHIHHFIPGAVLSMVAGAISLSRGKDPLDRWLAVPFGVGTALVLDETALLLEFEDVYWSEEGVLSIQVMFATSALLAALAYAVQLRRRHEPGAEADWQTAARAWDQLETLGTGRTARHSPGPPSDD